MTGWEPSYASDSGRSEAKVEMILERNDTGEVDPERAVALRNDGDGEASGGCRPDLLIIPPGGIAPERSL